MENENKNIEKEQTKVSSKLKNNKIVSVTALVLLLVVLIVAGVFLSKVILDENKNSNTNTLKETDSNFSYVEYESGKIFGWKEKGERILVAEKLYNHNSFDTSNGYLYYIDEDSYLHSVTLDDVLIDKELFYVELYDRLWDVYVDKHFLVVVASDNRQFRFDSYNIINSTVEKLEIESRQWEGIYDGKFYFIDEESNFKFYDIAKNQKIQIMSDVGTIMESQNNIIVYGNVTYIDDESYYVYDAESDVNYSMDLAGLIFQSHYESTFAIEDNKVYYVFNGGLYEFYKGTAKELAKFDRNYDYFSINSFENDIYIYITDQESSSCLPYDPSYEVWDCITGPIDVNPQYYTYSLKEQKLTEITEEVYNKEYGSTISFIPVK